MSEVTATRRIRIWDLPLRLFHWALLVCVSGAIVSMKVFENIDWHQRFGEAVLALLVFRIIWGFIGGRHARFLSFVRGPGSILTYLRGAKSDEKVLIGHNPVGALSVIALLLILCIQAISGLFLTDEILFEAPLFKYVSGQTASLLAQLHDINANIVFALIGLHLAAILFYRFVKRDNLVTPMITGHKEVSAAVSETHAEGGSIWLGLIIFGLASAIVWCITTQL